MKFLNDLHFANLNAHGHAGGFFQIGAGGVWDCYPHRFQQNKFYFVQSGRFEMTLEGQRMDGIPGRWFFIPAGAVHEYSNDLSAAYSHYWMHFDLLPHEVDLFRKLELPYYVDIPINGVVAQKFQEYTRLKNSTALADKIRVKALLLELVADYIQVSLPEDVGVAEQTDKQIIAVLEYIRSNIRENLTNSALADRFHMHPNHFVRFFRTKTDSTPAKYVASMRMEMAKNLLEESKLTISEIMDQIGMDDLSHFSKLFKKYYGVSPRKYRESLVDAVLIPVLNEETGITEKRIVP